MSRALVVLLLSALLHALLFFGKFLPEAWIETFHARGLFPLLRKVFSAPLSLLPFSLSQILLVLFALILAGACLHGGTSLVLGRGPGRPMKLLLWLLLWLLPLLLHAYLLGFGWLHRRPPLVRALGLTEVEDPAFFRERALRAARRVKEARVPLPRDADLAALDREARRCLAPALTLLGAPPLPPARLKPVRPAGFLLCFGTSGIFSPFTFEAHFDPGLDPLDLPMTVLHELAHLSGFAPEAEAGFVGFLAGSRSRNPWFRYSAFMEAFTRFEGLAEAGLRKRLREIAGPGALEDRRRAFERREAFRSRTLAKWSSRVYDNLLKSQGVAGGVRSYDRMIRLLLAWEKREEDPGK